MFIGHVNVILQCLNALPLLVHEYLDTKNSAWVSTKYNKNLKEFFSVYRKGYGPCDPLPLILSTLAYNDLDYNVFHEHDPHDTLKRLFYALLQPQKSVALSLHEGASISDTDTFLGNLITSVVQIQSMSCRENV